MKGNNNAYCQYNELSWYDWSLLEKNKSLFRFAKEIIAFRLRHPGFMRPEFYTGRDGTFNAMPDIIWFDEKGNPPDWDKLDTCLALRIDGSKAEILADRDDNDFFIMFNAGEKQVPFKVCRTLPNKKWFRAVDTGFPSPYDIYPVGQEQPLPHPDIYLAKSKSLVVLISKQL
jgi:glycogen operon protein